jgi:flavorubredoxin
MWHSTEKMARAIGEGLAAGGLRAKVLSLDEVHRSEVVYELLGSGAIAVGSATLNNNMVPVMADVMTYLRGLKPQNLVGAAFGSYGWSGEAVRQLEEILTGMKVDLAAEGIRVKHAPDQEALARCYELGVAMAEKVKGRLIPG